jgi:DNA-binding NarL/FixJ family response regulator
MSTLQDICEAVDGLEAVEKAEELNPHLILLDVGLPKLNGILAARQIRKVAPNSKILFLSQETSSEVVLEAIHIGDGYVFKTNGGGELLKAIDAVFQGRQFVSKGFPAIADMEAAD